MSYDHRDINTVPNHDFLTQTKYPELPYMYSCHLPCHLRAFASCIHL